MPGPNISAPVFRTAEPGERAVMRPVAPSANARPTEVLWPRLIAALIASVALAVALRDFGSSVYLLLVGDQFDPAWWAEPRYRALAQTALGVAAAAGAVIAGAGQVRAMVWGGFLGFWNALAVAALLVASGTAADQGFLLSLPIYQTLFGCLGGWFGALVYPPLETLDQKIASKLLPLNEEIKSESRRPTEPFSWGKIIIACAWITAGSLFAYAIRDLFILVGGSHRVDILQTPLATATVTIFVVVSGGFVAGANTRKGLGNGLVAGFLAGVLLFVTVMLNSRQTGLADSMASITGLSAQNQFAVIAFLQFVQALCLALFGGWLGQHVLPPTVKMTKRRLDTAAT